MKKAVLCALLVLCVLFGACQPSTPSVIPPTVDSSDKTNVGYPSVDNQTIRSWSTRYFTTTAMRRDGIVGGRGDTTKTCLTALADNRILVGTANAGVLYTDNAGELWQTRFVGLDSLGIDAVAADPHNNDFVVAVSTASQGGGIYVSYNGGLSFIKTQLNIKPVVGAAVSITFDPSSYRSDIKKCAVLYITGITVAEDDKQNVLLLSDDAGESFRVSGELSVSARIAVHPTKGYVYVAEQSGFLRSINRGLSFEMLLPGMATDVVVSKESPDRVLVVRDGAVHKSYDSGMTFESDVSPMPHSMATRLFVSPFAATELITYYPDEDGSITLRHSRDGGITWRAVFINDNPHRAVQENSITAAVWTSDGVYALCNNAILKSTDNAETFSWCASGDAGFAMTGTVSVNLHESDFMSFVYNDHTVAVSQDGGTTWELHTGPERLRVLAVYPYNRSRLVAVMYDENKKEYEIRLSQDGGANFDPLRVNCNGMAHVYGDPFSKDILFAANMRSEDGGKNWQEMTGCDAVLAHNPVSPGELFGVCGSRVVVSYDGGVRWNDVVETQTTICDVSYNYLGKTVYIATGDRLLSYDIQQKKLAVNYVSNLKNQFGETNITHVEVDPAYPQVVYIGGRGEDYRDNRAVMVSEDSGKTWEILTSNEQNDGLFTFTSGGTQPYDLVLAPDRSLICFAAAYGIQTLPPITPVS